MAEWIHGCKRSTIGLIGLLLGLGFVFYGFKLFLILLPIWGFFFGFLFGAGVVTAIFGDGFLATTTGWVVGFFAGHPVRGALVPVLLVRGRVHRRIGRLCRRPRPPGPAGQRRRQPHGLHLRPRRCRHRALPSWSSCGCPSTSSSCSPRSPARSPRSRGIALILQQITWDELSDRHDLGVPGGQGPRLPVGRRGRRPRRRRHRLPDPHDRSRRGDHDGLLPQPGHGRTAPAPTA